MQNATGGTGKAVQMMRYKSGDLPYVVREIRMCFRPRVIGCTKKIHEHVFFACPLPCGKGLFIFCDCISHVCGLVEVRNLIV